MSFGAERNKSGKTPDFGEHPDAAKKPQASKQKPNRRHGLEIGQAKPTDAINLHSVRGESKTLGDNKPVYDFRQDQLHQLVAALTVANRLGQEVDVTLHSTDGVTHNATIANPTLTGLPHSENHNGEVKPTQPKGAIGEVIPQPELDEAMSHFHGNWRRITGSPDRGILPQEQDRPGEPGLAVETRFLSTQNSRPYALNVRGVPATDEQIAPLLKAAKRAWNDANASGEDHVADQRALDVHGARYDELSDKRGGLWGLSIAVGGISPEDSLLNALRAEQALNTISKRHLFQTGDADEVFLTREAAHAAEEPFITNSTLVASALPIPLAEIPGIEERTRPAFAVNIRGSRDIPNDEKLVAGKILDNWDNPAGDFFVQHSHTEGTHWAVAGATGQGKTAFITQAIEQGVSREAEIGRTMGVVILDPKEDSHDYEDLVDRLARLGVKVNIIDLADPNAIRVGSRLFSRRPGESIQHRKDSSDMILANALASIATDDPGAMRTFIQYATDVNQGSDVRNIPSMHKKLGWDEKLDQSTFHAGEPPEPDLPFFIRYLGETIKGHYQYAGEGQNLEKWVPSFADLANRGAAQEFWNAYPYDVDKLRSEGVTLIKMGGIKNQLARSLMMLTIFDDILYAADGEQKTMIVVEEAQSIAPKDSPGAKLLAEAFRTARTKNVDLVTAFQNLSDASREIVGNALNRIAFGMTEEEDMKAARNALVLDDEQTAYLAELRRGQAIYKGRDTGPAVLIETVNPADRVVESTGTPGGPENIVAQSRESLLTQRQKYEAEQRLTASEEGLILDYWAQMAAGVELLGWDTPAPDDDYAARKNIQFKGFEKLRTMAQSSGTEKAKLEYMVDETVSKAVISRLELFKDEFPKEALIDKVKGSILAHLTDTQAPEPASYELPEFAAMTAKKERMYLFMSRNKNLISQRIAAAAEIDQLNGALAVIPASTPEHAALREQLVTTQQEAAALDTELVRYNAITYDPESRTGVTNPDDLTVIALEDMSQQHPLPDTLLLPSTPQGYLIDNPVPVAVADAIKSKDKSAWMAAHATILPLFRLTEAQRALIAEETGRVLDHKIAETEKTAAAEPAGRLDRVEILNNQMLQRLALLEKQVQDQKRHPEA